MLTLVIKSQLAWSLAWSWSLIYLAGTPLEDAVESDETSDAEGLYLNTKSVSSLKAYYRYYVLLIRLVR